MPAIDTIETRPFGSMGNAVASIGQGTWRSDETAIAPAAAALRRGLDLGMTHIDTAEMYGSGRTPRSTSIRAPRQRCCKRLPPRMERLHARWLSRSYCATRAPS